MSKTASFFSMCLSTMVLAIGLFSVPSAPAQASVAITPTLIVIEGRTRYADVTLINTSDTVNTYAMGWRYFRMEDETGAYQETDKSLTDFDLGEHLVFTPRRISLAPKAAQRIRLALRLKDGPPPPGEYRAHLELKEIPELKPIEGQENSGRISLGVQINVGFTIPVVYRVGESDASASIGNVTTRIDSRANRIEVVVPITRSQSKYGVLGDLRIYHKPSGKTETQVGRISNANIFAETASRTFAVPLNINALSKGVLRVVYAQHDKDDVFDEKIIPIQ